MFWWFTRIVGGGEFGTGGLVRMAVPYFFVTAGFMLAGHMEVHAHWWGIEVKKRLVSLVVPFLVWGMIFWGIISSCSLIIHSHLPSADLLVNAIGIKLSELPLLRPIWFLRSLFVLVVLSPVFCLLANPVGLIVLFLFHAIHMICPCSFSVLNNGIWHVTFSSEGMFYFTLGMFLRHHSIRIAHASAALFLAGVISFSCLVLYAYFDLNPQCELYCQLRNAFKFIAVPFCLLFVFLAVPDIKLPLWIRQAPFPVFLIHYIILYFGARAFRLVDLSPWMRLVVFLAFGIGGSVLLMMVIRRCSPSIARVLFGGR